MTFRLPLSVVVWMMIMIWNGPDPTFAQTTHPPAFLGEKCVGYRGIVGTCQHASCPHLQQDLATLPPAIFAERHLAPCSTDLRGNQLLCCPLDATVPPATTTSSSRRPAFPTPAAPASPGDVAEAALESKGISDVDITKRNKCNANAGAVGMYTTREEKVFLICKQALNLMPFSVDDPKGACHYPKKQQNCMTADCLPNLYRGFVTATYPSQGPCSGAFRPDQAKVDPRDCHTVDGSLQDRPARGSKWQEWRLCGGDSTSYVSFYVMTGAVVTKNVDKWSITSITCCRIKENA